MHMAERHWKRLAVALAVALLLPEVAVTTAAYANTDLALPRPTGSHPVGATNLWLKDTSRPDPWVPTQPYRELMMTVWYPTDVKIGGALQYMTPEDSTAILAGKHIDVEDPTIFSKVRTNALRDVAPAGKKHSLPLVVLTPGNTMPRMTLSTIAEDLASHGYVVAGIDHTGETYSVTFPDGHIVGCTTCALDDGDRSFFGRMFQSRARDVSFVLDRLTGPNLAWSGSHLIDASRIGISGHSAGGAASLAAMVHDPRIDAGIDMDGTTDTGGDPLVPATGFNRPFMVLNQDDHTANDPPLAADYAAMAGWKRWISVTGAAHETFGDVALMVDWLGLASDATIDTLRGLEISRQLNEAMFDQFLRGRPQPILNDPTACYPEVTRVW
jgi:dienelactone hydrolase